MPDVLFNNKGQTVGAIYDEGAFVVLVKRVHPPKHRLHSPPGYATDVVHLDRLERAARGRPAWVRLETSDGEQWVTSLAAFRENGHHRDHRGFGKQLALPDKYWSVRPRGQGGLFDE